MNNEIAGAISWLKTQRIGVLLLRKIDILDNVMQL